MGCDQRVSGRRATSQLRTLRKNRCRRKHLRPYGVVKAANPFFSGESNAVQLQRIACYLLHMLSPTAAAGNLAPSGTPFDADQYPPAWWIFIDAARRSLFLESESVFKGFGLGHHSAQISALSSKCQFSFGMESVANMVLSVSHAACCMLLACSSPMPAALASVMGPVWSCLPHFCPYCLGSTGLHHPYTRTPGAESFRPNPAKRPESETKILLVLCCAVLFVLCRVMLCCVAVSE